VDPSEPGHLVDAVRTLGLRHVVVTSPARDDLSDQGAGQFAAVTRALRDGAPGATVELLTPDFQGRPDLLQIVFDARPDIFNHNVETVRRLTPSVRARATYDGSLAVLRAASVQGLAVKSGLMVGLGETRDEIRETFEDLKAAGVGRVTVGQYLPPGPEFFPMDRFYSPEEFRELDVEAKKYFKAAMVGPSVRSSYHADEMIHE
jgi:lipoic acid synthetase